MNQPLTGKSLNFRVMFHFFSTLALYDVNISRHLYCGHVGHKDVPTEEMSYDNLSQTENELRDCTKAKEIDKDYFQTALNYAKLL